MNKEQLKVILEKHTAWISLKNGGERASLRGANLNGVDLSGSRLSYSDLRGASLSGADLSYSDLHGADLRGSRLKGADLRDADLRGSTGNLSEIKAVQCEIWPVTYTYEVMQIGCQRHLITEWWSFGDDEISEMDSRALEWWSVWKPILQTIIAASPAVPTGKEATQ